MIHSLIISQPMNQLKSIAFDKQANTSLVKNRTTVLHLIKDVSFLFPMINVKTTAKEDNLLINSTQNLIKKKSFIQFFFCYKVNLLFLKTQRKNNRKNAKSIH